MTGKIVFLGLLLVFMVAGAEGAERKPICPDTSIIACPLNLAPVCGSDGQTYANECTLCVHKQEVRKDILILKDGNC